MRKAIVIGLLLFSTVCFAEDTEKINSLIKTDLKGNINKIQEEAYYLSGVELLNIYDRHKKTAWLGALINWPLGGFGIGNFIQGDKRSGRIALTGYLAGISAGILGAFLDSEFNNGNMGVLYLFAGGSIAIGFHMYGFIRSLVYPSAYNKMLKTALQIGQTKLNIEPAIAMTGEKVALLARIDF